MIEWHYLAKPDSDQWASKHFVTQLFVCLMDSSSWLVLSFGSTRPCLGIRPTKFEILKASQQRQQPTVQVVRAEH